LKNPEEAAQMGQRGKEKIEKYFSKEIMTTKTLEFYEQIRTSFPGKREN
jgi:glycosyltransferase involved in cell wall biosynthesis